MVKLPLTINKSGKQASVDKYYTWIAVVCNNGRGGVTKFGSDHWKLDELEHAVLEELEELDIDSVLDDKERTHGLAILKQNINTLEQQIAEIQKQKERLVDAIAGGDAGLDVITDRIKALTNQEGDLIATKIF